MYKVAGIRLRLAFYLLLTNCLLLTAKSYAQQTLTDFLTELKKENELINASISLSAIDVLTGTVVCEYNPKLSLTPASTMKVITTASALQLLGKDFRYETLLQYSGTFDKTTGVIDGDLYIKGSGDPSLNSEYFRKEEDTLAVPNKWATVLKEKGVKKITGQLVVDISCFEEDIPANWVWGDMGNYFGAALWVYLTRIINIMWCINPLLKQGIACQ